ncbi:hypothetical protein EVG20_g8270 [Dentipellis fragilis]|uniref:PRA1 family protein n=1 Tax=Dentipellis fragilis TaxID=205917 RepID=A0A4Y9Y8B2_9AGAM|nr:hypothetical protein EVG20_g8270 [Dentipellis fragilis]
MDIAFRAIDTLKSFRETRLSALRPPNEFFDHNRVSRPADFNQAVSVRLSVMHRWNWNSPAHARLHSISPAHIIQHPLFLRQLWSNCRRARRLRPVSAHPVPAPAQTAHAYRISHIVYVRRSRYRAPSITSPLLLLSLGFLIGGFAAINKWGASSRARFVPPCARHTDFALSPAPLFFFPAHPAPEPMQVGDHVVTQKSLYTGLFVIGLPLLWWSSPLGTFFWLVGASGVLIMAHASLIEPGIESEYAGVQDSV